jgi:nucleoside-diphosphate-sugar epimerase
MIELNGKKSWMAYITLILTILGHLLLTIEVWGDCEQTRSFLYIDECIEAIRRLMDSSFRGPVNIGSEEMVTINQMAEMIMQIAAGRVANIIRGPLAGRHGLLADGECARVVFNVDAIKQGIAVCIGTTDIQVSQE